MLLTHCIFIENQHTKFAGKRFKIENIMETKEIIERVVNLLEPNVTETVSKLTVEELDYFIQHLSLDLLRSLKHWAFNTNLSK